MNVMVSFRHTAPSACYAALFCSMAASAAAGPRATESAEDDIAPRSGFTNSSYVVDFEGVSETKTSYASGNVVLGGLSWNFTDALIGTLVTDWRNGLRSARLRGYGTSAMTMLDPLSNGLGSITFSYRRYGTDSEAIWRVEYNIDGGAWIQAGSVFTASVEVSTFSANVSVDGLVRVRIRKDNEAGTSSLRLNIDDIVMTPYDGGPPPVRLPPQLGPAGNHIVTLNDPLIFSVYAVSTENDAVTLSATNLPPGASFASTGVTGQFTWASASPPGVYTSSFFAADVDGVTTQRAVITVSTSEYRMVIMAANLAEQTSACDTVYGPPATRIFQGIKPDIVGIQEWNVTNAGGYRAFVDAAFGTNFVYYVEPSDSCAMPNGIISRWPILQSGYWNAPLVSNRNFVWAVVDIPGDIDLRVVSVHLKAGSTPTDAQQREYEARALTNYFGEVPTNQSIVLVGDLNVWSSDEAVYTILSERLSDDSKPIDRYGNRNTSSSQDRRYDYILPDTRLQQAHRTLNLEGQSFHDGLVFQSSQWSPPPEPIQPGDSTASNIQHLAVIKAFTTFGAAMSPPPDAFSIDATAGESPFDTIMLTSQLGVLYTLQLATNLIEPPVTWHDMQELPGNGQTLQFQDLTNDVPFRVYRIKARWDSP